MAQLQREYDEKSRSLSDRLEQAEAKNNEYIEVLRKILKNIKFFYFILQKLNILQQESSEKIDELTTQLQEYQQQLKEEVKYDSIQTLLSFFIYS